MGINYNPSTVTSSIILAYDEANTKSGTSSELIARRVATVTSATERRFNQDTSLATMYASVAQYNSAAPSPGTGFSISAWIRRTGATSGTWDPMVLIDSGGPRYRMLWFGWFTNTTDKIHCSIPYYSATDTAVYWSLDPTWADAGLTLSINTWYNFSATYNNSTRLLTTYINAIPALSGTRPGLGDLNNPNNSPVQIYGCNNTPNGNSQVNNVRLYNRALTAEEVRINFNGLRNRYGV